MVKPQIVVLHIAQDLIHVFQRLRHLLFPRAGVGHHMGNMALVRARGIDRTYGVEVDIPGGADGVIRTEDRF